MKNKTGFKTEISKLAPALSCVTALLGAAVLFLVLYLNGNYLPFGLFSVSLMLPGLMLGILMIPKGRFGNIINAAAFVLLTAGAVIIAFVLLGRRTSLYKLSWAGPIIATALFIVFIILEKYCAHAPCKDGRAAALAKSASAALAASRLGDAVLFCGTVTKLLGFYEPMNILIWAVCIIGGYSALAMLTAFIIRIIRNEADTNPDISIPVPFSANSDYNLISYLESNTGITMRSLWSIRFIKKLLPYAVLTLILAFWAGTCIHTVEPNETGVLYRCGNLSDEVLEPGIHLTLPWPVDSVVIYDTKTVKEMTVGYESVSDTDNIWTDTHGTQEFKLLLGDGNELVSVNLRIEYVISDLLEYVRAGASPESLMRGSAYGLITDTVIRTDLNSLLSADRDEFSASYEKKLSEIINSGGPDGQGIGIEIISIVLESIHPPVDVAEKYQELISAEIKSEQLIFDAQSYAAITVAAAETSRNTAIDSATADRLQKTASAKASVAEFMAGVAADSSYSAEYRYNKYLTAIAKAYGNSALIIVDDKIDPSNIWLGSLPAVTK